MGEQPYIYIVSENDALPLEYKLENRRVLSQADVSDFIGDAALKRFLSPKESYRKLFFG